MRWNVSLDFEECSEFSLYKINDRVSNEDSNFYCLLNELWIQSKSVYLCVRHYSYHLLINNHYICISNILTLSGKEHTHHLYINQILLSQRTERDLTHCGRTFKDKVRPYCLIFTQWETPLARWKPNTVLYIFQGQSKTKIFLFESIQHKIRPPRRGKTLCRIKVRVRHKNQ